MRLPQRLLAAHDAGAALSRLKVRVSDERLMRACGLAMPDPDEMGELAGRAFRLAEMLYDWREGEW